MRHRSRIAVTHRLRQTLDCAHWARVHVSACSSTVRKLRGMNDAEGKRADRNVVPTVSEILSDNTIVELVYKREEHTTQFAVYAAGRWSLEDRIETGSKVLVPFSPDNNLIKNDVVLLPSQPQDYGSVEQLIADVQAFIHRYVDVTPAFEEVATHYVLLTWV